MDLYVTGAGGFLGSVLLEMAIQSENIRRVHRLVRKMPSTENGPGTADKLSNITYSDFLQSKEQVSRDSVLVHLASPGRITNDGWDYSYSMALCQQLVAVAKSRGLSGFVNASSQAIYGRQPVPWDESMPPRPRSMHGLSKVANEIITSAARSSSPQFSAISIRISKLIGPSPKFRCNPDEHPHKFLEAARKQNPVTVPHGGQNIHDYLDVRDAANAIMRLVGRAREVPPILNLSSGQGVELKDLASIVSEVAEKRFGVPLKANFASSGGQSGSGLAFVLKNDAIRKSLDWRPEYSLPQTLEDIADLV